MSNVLERIVATKQQHIEALKLRFPEESLTPKTSDRSLYQALSAKGAGFILECKKASLPKAYPQRLRPGCHCRYLQPLRLRGVGTDRRGLLSG